MSPTPAVVPDGDYVAMAWESERVTDRFQTVRLELAEKGPQHDASGSVELFIR